MNNSTKDLKPPAPQTGATGGLALVVCPLGICHPVGLVKHQRHQTPEDHRPPRPPSFVRISLETPRETRVTENHVQAVPSSVRLQFAERPCPWAQCGSPPSHPRPAADDRAAGQRRSPG